MPSPDDYAHLKARVEHVLAEAASAADHAVPEGAPASLTYPMDRCWALVTDDDTRVLLADPFVKALGGAEFAVVVDVEGVTVTRR